MKRALWVLSIMLLISLSLCSVAFATTAYKVTIDIDFVENWVFSKNDVDFYLNDLLLETLSHGEDYSGRFYAEAGYITLHFYEHGITSVHGSIDVNVQGNTAIKCTISCHEDRISVSNVSIITEGSETASATQEPESKPTATPTAKPTPTVKPTSTPSPTPKPTATSTIIPQTTSTPSSAPTQKAAGIATPKPKHTQNATAKPTSATLLTYLGKTNSHSIFEAVSKGRTVKDYFEGSEPGWYHCEAYVDNLSFEITSESKFGDAKIICVADLFQTGKQDLYFYVLKQVFHDDDLSSATNWVKKNLGKEVSTKIGDTNIILRLTVTNYPVMYLIVDEYLNWI